MNAIGTEQMIYCHSNNTSTPLCAALYYLLKLLINKIRMMFSCDTQI